MTLDLFAGGDHDFSAKLPNLKQARRIVERVEDLYLAAEDFFSLAEGIARDAEKLGAYSVARALRWMQTAEVADRNGIEHTHSVAERVARNWLVRQERRILAGGSS